MRFEVIVKINGVNQYLETSEYASFPINYNIADIADISKKNSSYSKTLSFPDTKENRKVFEFIYSIQSDSSFDPTKKSRCWIIKDTLTQLEGFLQLTDIVYDNEGNRSSYNCVIYADNGNLFTNIGERLLSDLDLSQFDHNWTINSITQSWTRDYTNGYYYPLIDYGFGLNYYKLIGIKGKLITQNFYPSYYLKPIVDQIILEGGYSYTSDFLNSFDFKNIVIPFSNKNLVPSISTSIENDNGILFKSEVSSLFSAPSIGSNAWGSSMNLDVDLINPGAYYNVTNFNYTQPSSASISQNFIFNFTIFTDGTYFSNVDDIYIFCKRSRDPNTGLTVSGWSNTPTYNQLISYPDIPFIGYAGGATLRNNPQVIIGSFGSLDVYDGILSTEDLDGSTINRTPLQPGEEVRFFFARFNTNPSITTTLSLGAGSSVTGNINLNLSTVGSLIETSKALPQNIKQKDFLSSVMKAFNLYIEPDKNNLNNLIIEPRDDYYRKYQTIKDWSDKLDVSKNINSQILSNTQKRINYFTYKEDKDYYNSVYKTNTGQVFGEYKSETNNEFTNGENKVELIFSPTPLGKLGLTDVYLPIIVNNNNGNFTNPDGMNPRMLYKDLRSYNLNGGSFLFGGQTFSFYPYAGPVNDPLNPTYSLNFGQVDMFYEGYNETINNLFFNYYQNQVEELNNKNARLITAYFKLDPQDISSFRFSDLIFFKYNGTEGYYRVNKIIDYDPSVNMTTKVELITAIDYKIKRSRRYSKPIGDSVRPGPIGGIGTIGIGVGTIGDGIGVISNGDNNSYVGPKSVLIGDDNSVSTSGSVLVLGDSNQASGEYILNTGTENQITGNYNLVLGDSNQASGEYILTSGVGNTMSGENITIFGNNNNLGLNNKGIFGNFIDSTIGSNVDIANLNGFSHRVGTGSNNVNLSGSNLRVTGTNSYSFGQGMIIEGENQFTFGQTIINTGDDSFVFGSSVINTGDNSFAAGFALTTTASNTFTIGYDTLNILSDFINFNGASYSGLTISTTDNLNQILTNGNDTGGINIIYDDSVGGNSQNIIYNDIVSGAGSILNLGGGKVEILGFDTSGGNSKQEFGTTSHYFANLVGGGSRTITKYFDAQTVGTASVDVIISTTASTTSDLRAINGVVRGRGLTTGAYTANLFTGIYGSTQLSTTSIDEKTNFSKASSDIFCDSNFIYVRLNGELGDTIDWFIKVVIDE